MFVDIGTGVIKCILDMGQPAAITTHQIGVPLRPDGKNDGFRFNDSAIGQL